MIRFKQTITVTRSIDSMYLHGFSVSGKGGTVPTSGWLGEHMHLVPPASATYDRVTDLECLSAIICLISQCTKETLGSKDLYTLHMDIM